MATETVLQDSRHAYLKAFVCRWSNYKVKMNRYIANKDSEAILKQSAITYLDAERLLRQVQGLVKNVPAEGDPDRQIYLTYGWGAIIELDISSIFDMPFGDERAWKVSKALSVVSDQLLNWTPEGDFCV